MKREEGFYWVKFYGEWIVAEWSSGKWYIAGLEQGLTEEDEIQEVEETKLKR